MTDFSKMSSEDLIAHVCEISAALSEKRNTYDKPFDNENYEKKKDLLEKMQLRKDLLKDELRRRLEFYDQHQKMIKRVEKNLKELCSMENQHNAKPE